MMKRHWIPLLLGSVSFTVVAGWMQKTEMQKIQPNITKIDTKITLEGKAIEGITSSSVDQQGRPQILSIQDVELDPADPEREVYLYTVVYRHSTASQSQNLCQPDQSGIAKAIPLSGEWNSSGEHIDNEKITFACTDSILAKCVRLGYKPWKTVNGQPLRDYHQACTRMLRADYCGDGNSHTQENTPIDVYDRLNIQQPTFSNDMVFEAAWSPEGAVWLNRTRYPDTLAQLQQECPEKLRNILSTAPEELKAMTANSDQPILGGLIFNRSVERSDQN